MLSKGARLSKHQVEYVLKHGNRSSSRYFFATSCPSVGPVSGPGAEKPLISSHFAAVVSKKVAPTAVERNSLRRRTYNAVRKVLEERKTLNKTLKKPIAMVIVVRKEAKNIAFSALTEDMGRLLAPF